MIITIKYLHHILLRYQLLSWNHLIEQIISYPYTRLLILFFVLCFVDIHTLFNSGPETILLQVFVASFCLLMSFVYKV